MFLAYYSIIVKHTTHYLILTLISEDEYNMNHPHYTASISYL